MRISELTRRSGVPNATIKFYLREGLLPPGRATSATQAEYSEAHLRRLRLIRALIGIRGLSVNATREVLNAVSEHEAEVHQVLGLVLGVRPVDKDEDKDVDKDEEPDHEPGRSDVDALVERMGWQLSEHAPARSVIAETLETLRSLGADFGWRTLIPYAELAQQTAALDLDQLKNTDDSLEQAERAVLLTILLEPALLALRRMAQEHESAVRHGG
ncbi:MerR family transcriptional regulator [Kitasatospora sp. NPDC048296]|uniref:MerR family transcriptional regulator n=1 Tax=Kitasatospora sp. NPDC048296 TaxID=3364048 RepID=UPI0037125978